MAVICSIMLFGFVVMVTGTDNKIIRASFKDATLKPPLSDQLSSIVSITNFGSCLRKCKPSDGCFTVVYDENTNLCTFYKSINTTEKLGAKEKTAVLEKGCQYFYLDICIYLYN